MAVCHNAEDWICRTKSKPAVPVPVSSRQWYFVFFGRFCRLSFNRDVLSLLHGHDPSKSPWAWQAGQGRAERCPGGAEGAPLIRADATPVCSEQLGTGSEQAAPCAISSLSTVPPWQSQAARPPLRGKKQLSLSPSQCKMQVKMFSFYVKSKSGFPCK